MGNNGNGRPKIVITGVGLLSPLGLNAEEHWEGLINGRSGIGQITQFDVTNYPVKIGGEVKGFEPEKYMSLLRMDRSSRCTQFAIAATKMALDSAKLEMPFEDPNRIGIIIATSGASHTIIHQAEKVLGGKPRRIDPLLLSKVAPSMVTAHVGIDFGIKGPNTSLNSACASGNDAIATAANHLLLGYADIMVAGGADTPINEISIAGTGRIGALSMEPVPEKASRPFEKNRRGFVYGEGAGILILETYEHAVKRGAPILAELLGVGWSFDAFNEAAPDAEQQAAAISMAIKNAGIKPEDIDYVNAHGTGTKLNDTEETKSLKIALGDHAYKVAISANKSMTGHLACAAGAVEAVSSVLTVKNGIIPPTINYDIPDPACDLDYVPNVARKQAVNICLSDAFGMGGQNCCIIIKRAGEVS